MSSRKSIGYAILCGAVAYEAAVAEAYPLKMPWRGDSLPGNTYMSYFRATHGTCAPGVTYCHLDIRAHRWDPTLNNNAGGWTPSVNSGEATYLGNPKHHVAWDMPLYSPVDGEIVACWRRMPDDDSDINDGPTGNDPDCPNGTECLSSGNHVNIKTADGKVVFIGHLKADSIPAGLCPKAGTIIGPEQDPDPNTCGTGWWKMAPATYLTTPIPVRKGQEIGHVGASGASDFPHIHMHVAPYKFDSGDHCYAAAEEIEFDEAWQQPRNDSANADPAAWIRFNGVGFNVAAGFTLLWPDPAGIRRDVVAIEAGSKPALTFISDVLGHAKGSAVYINADGDLSAVGFGIEFDESISLGTIVEKGPATQVDAANISMSDHHLVAAIRNGSGKLQLVPYFFGPSNDLDEGSGGFTSSTSISLVKATPSPRHRGVTVAYRNSSTGFLHVGNFGATVTASDIQLDARGTATSSSQVLDVDIARVTAGKALSGDSGTFRGVVTAERRSSDNAVILRSWSVSADGMSVSLTGSHAVTKAGGGSLLASDVDVTVVGTSTREFVVLSARDASNSNLWVQAYQLASTGAFTRLSEWQAGTVTAISSVKAGERDVAIGVQTLGILSILSFSVDANGVLRRVGTRDGSTMSAVALGAAPFTEDLVAGVVDADGDVVLAHFTTNYSNNL